MSAQPSLASDIHYLTPSRLRIVAMLEADLQKNEPKWFGVQMLLSGIRPIGS